MTDPMLDGITRYSVRNDYLTSRAAVGDEPFKGSTDVVLFSDLPALLAAAREDERGKALNEIPAIAVYGERLRSEGYDAGQRDEREACIDTVWLVRDEKGYSNPEWQKRIVAAIRAREES